MQVKICGLSREQDIDFVNEAKPDYIGFVFTESKRQISPVLAQYLRFRLVNNIIPVGIFVNSRIAEIAELYRNGIISIAQLHGDEDESYIASLKKTSGSKAITVIKVIKSEQLTKETLSANANSCADYLLIDSSAGSGKTFQWETLKKLKFPKPWFLAGGIDIKNLKQAMLYNPFAIDISSGAETDGIKDREKILQLVTTVKQGNII